MDTAHWPQGIGVVKAPMDGSKQPSNTINNNNTNNNTLDQRRATRPQKEQALNCPRCNSTNTKFCYYNNYSLTQPRYFCKTCRRYWTEGGSLRNVPVGGGSRKNKRPSSSSSTTTTPTTTTTSNSASQLLSPSLLPSSSNKKLVHDHFLPPSLNFPLHQNPKLTHQGQDLNLAYPPSSDHHSMSGMSFVLDQAQFNTSTSTGTKPSTASTTVSTTTTTTAMNTSSSSPSQQVSAMEFLRMAPRGNLMSSFMAMPVVPDHQFSSFANLGHHEFKPSLGFGLDHHQYHHQGGYGNGNGVHGMAQEITGARLLFPSEDLKQVSSTNTTNNTTTTEHQHDHHDRSHQFEQINRGQGDSSSSGYNWNGMLGAGSW